MVHLGAWVWQYMRMKGRAVQGQYRALLRCSMGSSYPYSVGSRSGSTGAAQRASVMQHGVACWQYRKALVVG